MAEKTVVIEQFKKIKNYAQQNKLKLTYNGKECCVNREVSLPYLTEHFTPQTILFSVSPLDNVESEIHIRAKQITDLYKENIKESWGKNES